MNQLASAMGESANAGVRVSGLGEQWNDVEHLNKTARPALHEQQRHGIGFLAVGLDEVNVGSAHLGDKMIEAIQDGFALSPVVVRGPVVRKLAQIVGIGAGF